MREREMKSISILMAVIMMFSICVFTSPITVNAQTQKKTAVVAVNAVYRNMIKDGNTFYVKTDNGIIAYNAKTKKSKKLVKKVNTSWGSMLKYNGYIYYTDYINRAYCIYKVDIEGKKAAKLLFRNASLGFIYNNRIFFDNKGLCSMSLNGTGVKRHTLLNSGGMAGNYLFYHKNRFYYGDTTTQYSVDTHFKNKKKSADAYGNISKVLHYTLSASSVEMNNGSCWADHDKAWNYNKIIYSQTVGNKSVRKTIYKSTQKNVSIVASDRSGYMMIAENKEKPSRFDSVYKSGTIKIINLKGKVIATLKSNQK